MTVLIRTWLATVCAALLLVGAASPLNAEDKPAPRKPPTKVTQKLSAEVFKQIEVAQTALDAKNYDEAERTLNALRQAREGKLNDYEQAQIFNFLAAVHYEQEELDASIQDYLAIVRLADPPEQLKTSALFRLAQIYFVKEDYARSLKVLDQWIAVAGDVSPEALMLKAQAYYQMEQYAKAEEPILKALAEARKRGAELRENWLALLRAVYYETGQYDKAIRTLRVLVQRWPSTSYYQQLSGMYGLAKDQKKQLYVMHAAYVAGLLDAESDLLNMARLYMAEDAPYPAIEMLLQAMSAGKVSESAQNLQLLAQAMGLAKDYEGQIPVLKKAAAQSNDAQQYMYLGQAQLALYDWGGAAESLRKALAIGGLERPGSVYMQLGTAYYNNRTFGLALDAFRGAGLYEETREKSEQWVRFVIGEIAREKALRG